MNPGDHLFLFVTKDAEFKWIVRPDDVRKMSPANAGKYLMSLHGTIMACEDQLKGRKELKVFYDFGDRLFKFAYKHARKTKP